MKLHEALLRVKNLKSQLAKADKAVVASIIHYEGEPPEYNYVEELGKRLKLIKEIASLKLRIQETNVQTATKAGGSLADLVLANADCRNEIAFVNRLLEETISYGSRFSGGDLTTDNVKKRYAEGYDKKMLRDTLEKLELSKEKIESEMAYLNMTTELVSE